MQSRIHQILISLLLALPVSLGTTHLVQNVGFSDAIDTIWFYCDFPERLSGAVASFITLPERMNPTLSECN